MVELQVKIAAIVDVSVPNLAKHGVKLISITQPLGNDEDPAQAMMRKVIALFDEYQSKENAKHVLRNMKLNARQGFWNGSPEIRGIDDFTDPIEISHQTPLCFRII